MDKIFKCLRARKKKKEQKFFLCDSLRLENLSKLTMEKIIVEGLCGKGVS